MQDPSYINSVNLYSCTNFPYLVLNVEGARAIPRNPGFRVMHWHEDLQFIYVLEGTVLVKTLEEGKILSAGDGIFINKSVIHLVMPGSEEKSCRYNSFLFPEYFLNYYPGSPVEITTRQLSEDAGTPTILFHRGSVWEEQILAIMKELTILEEDKGNTFYCQEVLLRLNELWLILLKNLSRPDNHPENSAVRRTRMLLTYMEAHYAENISLKDLADSAHISKSEALRCFRESLQTTPYRYLMDYRLMMAEKQLKETDLPIDTISEMCGFHQQSYFTKCFRETTGYTPGEYRKNNASPLRNKEQTDAL